METASLALSKLQKMPESTSKARNTFFLSPIEAAMATNGNAGRSLRPTKK